MVSPKIRILLSGTLH